MSKLKYYDGTDWKIVNGQVTGDTLPIGSEVDFDGQTVPAGWQEVNGENLVAYELYINNTGSSGEITLSDYITNYEIIKVFYFNGNIANSVEFKPLAGTTNFMLESSYKSGSSLIHTLSRYVCTNGNKMTPVTDECGYWGLSDSTIAMHYDSTNYSKIYKVIGYK